jgi:excisionase family DNA binding protein
MTVRWQDSQAAGMGGPSAGSEGDSQRMEVKVDTVQPRDDDALLTPSEVAAMFRVNPKTVTRWARAGKISAIRTLGGHRRFRESEIRQFLEQVEQTEQI